MTKREALAEFTQFNPVEKFKTADSQGRRRIDEPARDQAWNDFTDGLCKEGRITTKQYESWHSPWS